MSLRVGRFEARFLREEARLRIAAPLLVTSIAIGSGVAAGPGDEPNQIFTTGADVVEAMIERFADTWYRDVTFVQTTSYYDSDENVTRSETWYESIRLPGKLRIDVAPLAQDRVLLFNDDVQYQFLGGELQGSAPVIHPLLLMGFDVYFLTLEEVLAKLQALDVDLERMYESTWQGRPVYVLGADEGDESAHQFWIDQERLVLVRQLRGVQETQFNRYERLGGGWISPEVVFLNDGTRTVLEEYEDIRTDHELEDGAFFPDGGTRPAWVSEAPRSGPIGL